MSDLIFDIGMHVGQDTHHYLQAGYRVLAIEANPILVENAQLKFKKEIESGKLTILNVGISDREGILPFYRNLRLSEWSSFDKEIGSRNNTKFEQLDVTCTTTKILFEKYGIPYFMKIDIEGNDHFSLRDIPSEGNKPQYVSCEACSIDWLNLLKEKGYTKFKVISQGDSFKPINIDKEKQNLYVKSQVIKNGIKLRLQKFISFKHPVGSSGPFGETTKGDWLTYDEAANVYNMFYQKDGTPLNPVSWFDFHATY